MTRGYHFELAAEYSLVQLADVVTEAFRGYPLPVYESAARLARLVRVYGFDLSHSLVMRAPTGEFAGVSFLGLRGTRAWVTAFGITPAHRGHGLGRELLSRLLDQARAARAEDIRLEVLANNMVARRLYQRAGFTALRELVSLERAAWLPQPPRGTDLHTEHVTVDAAVEAARLLERTPPCWQRESASLLTGSAYALTVRSSSRLVGCSLHSTRDGAIALHHVAARTDIATGVIQTLLPQLVETLPGATGRQITLLNEPEPGGIAPALVAHGFRETMRQLELHRLL